MHEKVIVEESKFLLRLNWLLMKSGSYRVTMHVKISFIMYYPCWILLLLYTYDWIQVASKFDEKRSSKSLEKLLFCEQRTRPAQGN